MQGQDATKYGIVVDSGSSGSRVQIYAWEDPKKSSSVENDPEVLLSPPKIHQENGWTYKIKGGVSNFGTRPDKVWPEHYQALMTFAESIIPELHWENTPVFVLLTAGMRLLPAKQLQAIRDETCNSIRANTRFHIGDCSEFVQTIDGETEGLYGWVGLNYLMGQFNGYTDASKEHESIGFMDMGGALTQIAFVPLYPEDVSAHDEDLLTVSLRNVNGETQVWRVFVETWLGFGANEARRRYLNQLVNNNLGAPTKLGSTVSDPCMPKGTELSFLHESSGKEYKIKGKGSYSQCVKSIYPLLLKNIPCKSEPCLFNGIHGPRLNFEKDKFVGISEYWYTANDIFQLGGEYNYHAFNEKVMEYCESDWTTILQNLANGEYSKLDPDMFLKDACFKASWVMNVLHEGFELPRLGIDPIDSTQEDKKLTEELPKVHVPFKSANSVNGEELSWTLGKMLLFSLSEIEPKSGKDVHIGIQPSEISGGKFIAGGGSKRVSNGYDSDSDDEGHDISVFQFLSVFVLIFAMLAFVFRRKKSFVSSSLLHNFSRKFPIYVQEMIKKIPGSSKIEGYSFMRPLVETGYDLEEGLGVAGGLAGTARGLPEGDFGQVDDRTSNMHHSYPSVLRTRSSASLTSNSMNDEFPKIANFLNRPFIPKPSSSLNLGMTNREAGKDIQRSASSGSPWKNSID